MASPSNINITRNHTGHRMGEQHQNAHLSDSKVAKMRRMYKPGVVGYKVLAGDFKCGVSTVRDIVQYRTRP